MLTKQSHVDCVSLDTLEESHAAIPGALALYSHPVTVSLVYVHSHWEYFPNARPTCSRASGLWLGMISMAAEGA